MRYKDDFEFHKVDSQPVPKILACKEPTDCKAGEETREIDPWTKGKLLVVDKETGKGESNEKISEIEDATSFIEIETPRLRPEPAATIHLTALFDIQSVL